MNTASLLFLFLSGLLVSAKETETNKHFDITSVKSLCNGKNSELKSLTRRLKNKIEKFQVTDSMETLYKALLKSVEAHEEKCKEVTEMCKNLTAKSDDSSTEPKDKKIDGAKDHEKTDAVVLEWVDAYHKAAVALDELDYSVVIEVGKKGDITTIEDYVRDYELKISGFLAFAKMLVLAVPALVAAYQFA